MGRFQRKQAETLPFHNHRFFPTTPIQRTTFLGAARLCYVALRGKFGFISEEDSAVKQFHQFEHRACTLVVLCFFWIIPLKKTSRHFCWLWTCMKSVFFFLRKKHMYGFRGFWAKYMIRVCTLGFSGSYRPAQMPKGLFGMGIFPQLTQQFSDWKLTWSLEHKCELQLTKKQTVFVLNISIPCFLNIYVCSMVRCDACCWMPFFHNQRPMSSQLLGLDSWTVMFVAGTSFFGGLPKPCNSGWILCWVLWREPH